MPELPEVETVKKGLEKAIVGKKIADYSCDTPKMTNFSLNKVKGLKVIGVRRRAKMLIIDLSADHHILVHLKMTGQLVYRSKKQCLIGGHQIEKSCESLPNKFTHATFTFSDGTFLYYNDIRKFGWVRLYTKEQLAKVFEQMGMGPEPLSKDFTIDYLRQRIRQRPRNRVKQFIMDNKILVGVGNIYSDEVCYYAKVRPDRRVETLTDKEIKLIHSGIAKILKAAIEAQGTTFSNYVNADGEAGAYTKKLKVYGRYGETCFKCRGIVARMKIGGRTSSFCVHCQI